MEDRPLPSTPPAQEADRLIASGPAGWRLGRFGRHGHRVARAVGRVSRGRLPYQQVVDRYLLSAIGHVDRRVDTLVARMDTRDRALDRTHSSLKERLRSGEELTDDVVMAVDALRGSIADLAARVGDPAQLPRVEDLLTASRARPYVEPSYRTWDEPGMGSVMGYSREGLDPAAEHERYRIFEDRFRGPEERVRTLQRPYLPLLEGRAPVLDIGCGRGEMLDLLREQGTAYHGIDVDEAMIARCVANGHSDVELADAIEHLAAADDGHYGAIFSAQVVEHLPAASLHDLLALAARKLRPDGLLIAETVNPHAPHALRVFWTDLTHQHPIFPEVALALCELAGFNSAYVFHPTGSGCGDVDAWTESAYAVVARLTASRAADG